MFSLFVLLVLTTPISAFAADNDQFITIVNPIRISYYTENPPLSVQKEYMEVKKRELPATWLLTYDAISDQKVLQVVKSMDQKQELGIFMEVTPKFAEDAKVVYNKTDSWHRAKSVFLIGYTPKERTQLIDRVFSKFKDEFGYYPQSVGAWWIDSFSLDYMQKKYGITANLGVADQFETDGYKVWGQYWSTPYYPSKLHAAIPARSVETKLNVVTLQWAPRDPLNGYGKRDASLFSTQDYYTINLDDRYYQKLIELYGEKHHNSFGQITLGLEGDFGSNSYSDNYSRWMDIIKKYHSGGGFQVVTMRDFARWYQQKFPGLSPAQLILSDDLLSSKRKVIWYQSPTYRIGMVIDEDKNQLEIRDFRTYHTDIEEPYNLVPNRQLDLFIKTPALIDTATNPLFNWVINDVKAEQLNGDYNKFILDLSNNRSIVLSGDSVTFRNITLPQWLPSLSPLTIETDNGTRILAPRQKWLFPSQGLQFRDLTTKATFFLQQKKTQVIMFTFLGLGLLALVVIWRIKKELKLKLLLLAAFFLTMTAVTIAWLFKNTTTYFVSQSELESLTALSQMPQGRVLVYDNYCLQCGWSSKYAPAVYANKRKYVASLSHKQIVYNSSVLDAKNREEGRRELQNLGVKYLYLVRYENYKEDIPFSPGDYNLEKVYETANSTIWQVKHKSQGN